MSKGLTSEFPLPAKNECRSNRKSEGEDFSKWLKKILFCPLQQVGKQVVVVEEKGWERRKGSESLPGAGTGKGRGLHSETQSPAAQPGEIPLCVASPAPALHTMSARSALILPAWDSLSGTETQHSGLH